MVPIHFLPRGSDYVTAVTSGVTTLYDKSSGKLQLCPRVACGYTCISSNLIPAKCNWCLKRQIFISPKFLLVQYLLVCLLLWFTHSQKHFCVMWLLDLQWWMTTALCQLWWPVIQYNNVVVLLIMRCTIWLLCISSVFVWTLHDVHVIVLPPAR